MTYLLVITSGKGAYSAPYHLAADTRGQSRCGHVDQVDDTNHAERYSLIEDTPANRIVTQRRGQRLCESCRAWETRQANGEAKLRDPKIVKRHAEELAALARWNAAAKGAPLP